MFVPADFGLDHRAVLFEQICRVDRLRQNFKLMPGGTDILKRWAVAACPENKALCNLDDARAF
jgi:hypothetical protein